MAFFGITHLGYQNPIGDQMLVNPRTSSSQDDEVDSRGRSKQPSNQVPRLKCTDTCSMYSQPAPYSPDTQHGGTYSQPAPYSPDIHHGSQERYREMLKRVQTPRSPNQLYSVPLTDSQQYGWWLPSNGQGKMQESWTRVQRFPRKNSEMTKFVKDMSMTDREFSLF